MENSILNLSPEEFESAIEELGLTPEDQEFLREEYKSNNSVSGNVEQAFQPEQGQERSTFLPMTKPEGVSSMDALLSGQANLALPGAITEGIQEVIEGVEAPGWAASGLEDQGTLEDAWKTAGVAAGGAATATVPDGSLRMFGGKRARGANYSGYVKAKDALNKGQDPDAVWKETGWAMNRNGQLRFEIDDDEFNYYGVPDKQYYSLGDVADHPKLFDNYPELKSIRISEQLLEDDHFGFMDFDVNDEPYIVINSNMPREEKINTILHEVQHVVQSIEDPNFAGKYAQNSVAYGYHNQPEEVEAELPGKRLKMPQVDRKASKPSFAEGGVVTGDNMEKLFAEGGINTGDAEVDPVSGNEVPPGSLPEEVRDDIDAKLSGGEYVVPADVLRFYGVNFFEKLRKKAKEGLSEMDAEGRIGGDSEEEDDDLPFSEEELMVADEEDDMEFAAGGAVPFNPNSQMFGGQVLPTNPGAGQAPKTGQTSNPVTQNSGGMETKTYENTQGQKMQILFINGQPAAPVPSGFYPEGQAPKQTTPGPKEGTQKMFGSSDREELRAQERKASGGGNASTGRTWDPGIDFSDSKAVEGYVSQELNQAGKFGGAVGGIGGAILGPIAGTIGSLAISGSQVSNARAASIIARAQGNTELADKLDGQINEYVESRGIGGKTVMNAIATGELKARKYLEANKTGGSGLKTTQLTTTGQKDRYGNTLISKSADSSSVRTPGGKTVTVSKGGAKAPATSGDVTVTKKASSSSSSSRPSSTNNRTSGNVSVSKGNTRKAEGGLIERRKK